MRRWIRFTVLGTLLTAFVLPPAHARGTTASAPARVAVAPTVHLGLYAYPGTGMGMGTGTEEVSSPVPESPPAAKPRPAAKLPLCHEVTPVGVVVERASACSQIPR
jgi:hypothetical protein